MCSCGGLGAARRMGEGRLGKERSWGEGSVGACLVMTGSSGATASKKMAAALSWHSEHVKLFLLLLRVVFW